MSTADVIHRAIAHRILLIGSNRIIHFIVIHKGNFIYKTCFFYPVCSSLVRRRITVVVRVLTKSSHRVCKFICSLQHEGDVHCHQNAAIICRFVCCCSVHNDDNNDHVLTFIFCFTCLRGASQSFNKSEALREIQEQ